VRQRNASDGLARLSTCTDTLITIPNDRLLQLAPRNLPLDVAFRMADDVLRQAVQGITELITEPGIINVDFAHIRHMMKLGGGALMALGQGQGENKALKAVQQALHHPLLENISIENAKGILVNFTAGEDLTLFEIEAALSFLQQQAGPQAEIVMGVADDERMPDRVQATLIITGLGAPTLEETLSSLQPQNQAQARPVAPASISSALPTLSAPPTAAATRLSMQAHAPNLPQAVGVAASSNLDLPAFLRRSR
jgi:cell division protein FtsZ